MAIRIYAKWFSLLQFCNPKSMLVFGGGSLIVQLIESGYLSISKSDVKWKNATIIKFFVI